MESIAYVRAWMWSTRQSFHISIYASSEVTFNLFRKLSLLGHDLFNPNNTTIDWRLVVGATCFGLGWGIGGLCPGPAIMQFSIFTIPIHIIWFGFLIIGMLMAKYLEHYLNELKKREKEQKEKEEIEHAHHKSAKEHSHHHHHKHPHRGTHKEI